MNFIMRELENREKLLVEYAAKEQRRDELQAELNCLNQDLSQNSPETLKAEIEELKGYAIKLGFIQPPVEDVQPECATQTEELAVEETAPVQEEPIAAQPVTTI